MLRLDEHKWDKRDFLFMEDSVFLRLITEWHNSFQAWGSKRKPWLWQLYIRNNKVQEYLRFKVGNKKVQVVVERARGKLGCQWNNKQNNNHSSQRVQ